MALEHLGFPFTGPLSTHTFNIDISRHPGLRSFFPPPPPTMHSHWEPVGRSRSASHHCNLARAPSPVALSSHFQLCLETTPPRHPPHPHPGHPESTPGPEGKVSIISPYTLSSTTSFLACHSNQAWGPPLSLRISLFIFS